MATGSPTGDVDYPPLRPDELSDTLVRPGGLWREVRVVQHTTSTNADLAAGAAGAAEGVVRVAEFQSAGRGRLDRGWQAPARAALTFSVLLTPQSVAPTRWPWLPLLTGVAVVDALADVLPRGDAAGLKWPNDVLLGDRKLAGILAERVGEALVLGVGLNVAQRAHELPIDTATSLAVAGARSTDRTALLVALLERIEVEYLAWRDAGGDVVGSGHVERYRQRCVTLGQRVRVHLPGDDVLYGTAGDVTAAGSLVVRTDAGVDRELAAGDVVHLRPAS